METNTFAASGEDVITRTLDIDVDRTADRLSQEEFQDFYEVDRTAQEIVQGDYKRIALQFPDELLHDSVPIFRALKSRVGDTRDLYVLADTSYGSCCVDEVAAQHVNADAIVHYGHACLSLKARLPVIYVFGKNPLDVSHCVASFVSAYDLCKTDKDDESRTDVILLRHDVAYTHLSGQLVRSLQESFNTRNATVVYHSPRNKPESQPQLVETDLKPTTIFYVGPESLALTNLITTNFGRKVLTYDPASPRPSAVLASSAHGTLPPLLKRRYAQVLKARDSSTIGILIGALPSSPLPSTDDTSTSTQKAPKNPFLPLLTHLRRLITKSGRKSYTIAVGKPNPAKLANFLEVECWVLVACSENSLLLAGGASSKAGGYHSSTAGWAQGTGKDYLQPIVTPFELEIALRDEVEWTGKYVLDFEQVLQEASERSEEGEAAVKESESGEEVDADMPKFSLVTGTYRPIKRYGVKSQDEKIDERSGESVEGDSAVVLRNQEGALSKLGTSAAAHYLSTRSYQGLDPRLGVDEPSVLEQGRNGIARGYQDDQEHQELQKKSTH